MKEAGHSIAGVCCRSRESACNACSFMGAGDALDSGEADKAAASADVVIIATPDNVIGKIEEAASRGVKKGGVVLHLSGALPSLVLEHCRSRGAHTGSMHPLQSFAVPEAAIRSVPGSLFACEGDGKALGTALMIAESIGGKPVEIDTASKPLYHAAAASASNFLIAPILLAVDLMEKAGLDRKTGLEALAPLILGTCKNATQVGVPGALTGPIERGDHAVVADHLKAIEKGCPELLPIYIRLARMTLDAAKRKGRFTPSAREELERILMEH